jgi:hypothetical protein
MKLFGREEVANPEVGGTPVSSTGPEADGKTQAQLLAETITGALAPLTSAIGEIKTRQEAFEARFQQKTQAQEPTQPRTRTSIFDDEDMAIAERVAPLYQQNLELEASMVRDRVRSEYISKGYGPVWEQFSERINSLLDAAALIDNSGKKLRGDPAYIRNVVNMVIGEAATAAGLKFGGKDKGFFLESASGGDGSSTTTPVADGMTEGQRKVFARMKVPVAEAQKTIGRLKFVN